MRELYEKIKKGTDRRASLIALKKELKDEEKKKVFLTMTGNRLDEIMKCLVDEDPKVRKNAAAILGELHCQDALDVLMDAYEEEDKLLSGKLMYRHFLRLTAASICLSWKSGCRNWQNMMLRKRKRSIPRQNCMHCRN